MGEDRLESLVLVDSPITSVCEQAHSKPHTNGGGGGPKCQIHKSTVRKFFNFRVSETLPRAYLASPFLVIYMPQI
jgi:hypothetical protein